MKKIFDSLLSAYGPRGWWPILNSKNYLCEYHPNDYSYPRNESERFEICAGAILTQNTTWNNAACGLVNLKSKNLLSPDRIMDSGETLLKKAILPAGYYNQKAKKLKLFSEFFISLDGRSPARDELLSVWGIGEETADSILLYAYNEPSFVVDAYTKRIFSRIGIMSEKSTYGEIKKSFECSLKPDSELYQEYHALIVEHAKRHCRKTPLCDKCPISGLCKAFQSKKSL